MNIILLGQQGSGKGTQAEKISKKLNLFYFETGRFLRKLAESDTLIDELVNKKGVLVPEDIIIGKIKSYFAENKVDLANVLFDGFPRNIAQYKLLEKWFAEKGQKIDLVIFLKISDEETIKRLSSRRVCVKCGQTFNLLTKPADKKHQVNCGGELIQRPDDTPEAISKRLDIYHHETEPLLALFSQKGLLKEIDGSPPIPEVEKSINKILGI